VERKGGESSLKYGRRGNLLKITLSTIFPKRELSDIPRTFSMSDVSQFLFLGIGIAVLVKKSLGIEHEKL